MQAFTFDDATRDRRLPGALGISHCYASSYFKAVPGARTGTTWPIRPGSIRRSATSDSYAAWVGALRAHGMGHIIDLVPNHMGIAQSANPWWQDVLENGPSSRYADVFDIDWHPLKQELENKVLLPVLGDSYGAVLERQEITAAVRRGRLPRRATSNTVLPIAPGTYDRDPRRRLGDAARGGRRERCRHRVPQHPHGDPAPSGTRCPDTGASSRTRSRKRSHQAPPLAADGGVAAGARARSARGRPRSTA